MAADIRGSGGDDGDGGDVLLMPECEAFVQSLKLNSIEELGSPKYVLCMSLYPT